MGSVDGLRLHWDEYEPNIKNGFSQLRIDEDFYDVTLTCGESHIQAHKVILGACSSFFKSLLKSVPHQHPLLYLGGIEFKHLESVLSFMYDGEVRVKPDELDQFLAVAQELRVNGLMQVQFPEKLSDPLCESEDNSDFSNGEAKRLSPETSMEINKETVISFKEEEFDDINPVESSSSSNQIFFQSEYNVSPSFSEVETQNQERVHVNIPQGKMSQINELLNAKISEFVSSRGHDSKLRCLKCPYSSVTRINVMRHIEARHFKTNGFPCDICGRRYKTRDSLNSHKRMAHKNCVKFPSTGD